MARSPWIVNVSSLKRTPGAIAHEERRAPMPGLRVTDSWVPEGCEVSVSVDLQATEGSVLIHGTIAAPWAGECRRCLGPAAGEVSADVRELYEADGTGDDTYALRGDQVDLEPLARDAVLLELPLAPLCTEGCLGLCLTCGANRNEVDCGHDGGPPDPRWSALDALKAPE